MGSQDYTGVNMNTAKVITSACANRWGNSQHVAECLQNQVSGLDDGSPTSSRRREE